MAAGAGAAQRGRGGGGEWGGPPCASKRVPLSSRTAGSDQRTAALQQELEQVATAQYVRVPLTPALVGNAAVGVLHLCSGQVLPPPSSIRLPRPTKPSRAAGLTSAAEVVVDVPDAQAAGVELLAVAALHLPPLPGLEQRHDCGGAACSGAACCSGRSTCTAPHPSPPPRERAAPAAAVPGARVRPTSRWHGATRCHRHRIAMPIPDPPSRSHPAWWLRGVDGGMHAGQQAEMFDAARSLRRCALGQGVCSVTVCVLRVLCVVSVCACAWALAAVLRAQALQRHRPKWCGPLYTRPGLLVVIVVTRNERMVSCEEFNAGTQRRQSTLALVGTCPIPPKVWDQVITCKGSTWTACTKYVSLSPRHTHRPTVQ